MLLAALALQLTEADPSRPCTPVNDGPAEGMCLGPVVSKSDAFELVALLPSTSRPPAMAPDTAVLVERLLDSQRKQIPIDAKLLAPGATTEFCAAFSDDCRKQVPLKKWLVGEEVVPGTAYPLADGRIRIEWLKAGRVQYLSFITFEATTVKDIATLPAQIPVKVSK